MLEEYIKIIFINLKNRKLRSALTIIGIFIGIAAVVSLISISEGMNIAIKEQFEKMGADKIIIMPGGGEGMFFTFGLAPKPLTKEEVDKVASIQGVDIASGVLYRVAKVSFNNKVKNTYVIGISKETIDVVKTMQQYELEKGRDFSSNRFEAIVGHDFAYEIFDREIKLGDEIRIDKYNFKVVGILKKIGTRRDDMSVIISLENAEKIFNTRGEVSMIVAKVKEDVDVDKVANDIREKLRKFRNEKKGEESFQVQTSQQLLYRIQQVLGMFQILLIGIAAISLIVGGVGIMNTQYTSVLERTREIGIMKAIGASNMDIMIIFLIEAGAIGLLGGFIGCILGIGIAKIIEIYASSSGFAMLKAYISPVLIIFSLLFSFFVGAISGFAPALRAARMQPAEALRYE
ncbi:MAG: ABC transporter permease [Candidatus Aenigmatarchaeota archaeon]